MPRTPHTPHPSRPPEPPRTYDEIVKRTVPEPDTSFRPTAAQERAAAAGIFVASIEDERDDELASRVIAALHDAGATGIEIELRRGRATLRGAVPAIEDANRYEAAAAGVDGITGVDDQMYVAPVRP